MPDPEAPTYRLLAGLKGITAEVWDACARPAENPFVSYTFLSALEDARCVGPPETGWIPRHILVEQSGALAAAAPAYVKLHSQGEYVFDHGWAEAYERAGGNYYPKLQLAVPFTPVPGPRLLVKSGANEKQARAALVAAIQDIVTRNELSGAHATFCQQDEWQLLQESGFLLREDRQFHWLNDNYKTFDDFLNTLISRKRKTIRRERQDALKNSLAVKWLRGNDITETHWDAFFAFYMDTGARKWGQPYLNRTFFSLLGERMNDKCLLVFAMSDGRPVAGALNIIGTDTLYGRYWGALEDHPFLHFELCYYQAIDYAITHGLKRVEAGAQGEHKLIRGYTPAPTYSAHFIADPALKRAVAGFLKQERAAVTHMDEELNSLTPYKAAPSFSESEQP